MAGSPTNRAVVPVRRLAAAASDDRCIFEASQIGGIEMKTFIALLRGINVTGRNKIPMAELREVCSELGWADVKSYIQSGNLVFNADAKPDELEADLEGAIKGRFGLTIHVMIRAGSDWPTLVAGNPFPEESASEPNRVLLSVPKSPPKEGAAEALQERAVAGERVVRVGDVLWVHFPNGAGTSKISPALLDRLVGSPVTGRNLRTVLKLDEMAREIRTQ
jgi:uncharacterized protein (DUF1697 family)